jgi:DNA-binding PadR family transcriptional regulator
MSVAMTVLGLVEAAPRHGYEVRKVYDAHFAAGRPLKTGQLYATLGRLERDALIVPTGVDQAGGPERTVFTATRTGRDQLEAWLGTAEPEAPYLQSVVFAKVLLALMVGRSAAGVLEVQRAAHLVLMREWTGRRRRAPTTEAAIAADFVLFHLDADLRWLQATAARLDRLAAEVSR